MFIYVEINERASVIFGCANIPASAIEYASLIVLRLRRYSLSESGYSYIFSSQNKLNVLKSQDYSAGGMRKIRP